MAEQTTSGQWICLTGDRSLYGMPTSFLAADGRHPTRRLHHSLISILVGVATLMCDVPRHERPLGLKLYLPCSTHIDRGEIINSRVGGRNKIIITGVLHMIQIFLTCNSRF